MKHNRILLFGGSGFIGSHIAAQLAARNLRVIVPTRKREHAQHLLPLPTVEVVEADVNDDAALASLVRDVDAVINMIAILHGRRGDPYGPDFGAVHVELPKRLADACVAGGVRRFIHTSALGVGDAGKKTLPSMYLRSKAAGEQMVRQTLGLDWTIFRPSIVFGAQDRFLNLFAHLQFFLPVMAVARAGTRLQPIHVEDVARAYVNALDEPRTYGRVYSLAGPTAYTLGQLIRLAGQWSGHPRPVIELPDSIGRLQAKMLGIAPGPRLMSEDNFDSLAIDNVTIEPMAPELGVTPARLETIAPHYLSIEQTRLDLARARARR